ncbi:unnamed protein product [Didymodactylos carnosus]|uniref:Uncharacterized protein n=1 Tax=Didymodactylos carnosus TaxID=1234261 RepID=A0A815V587_9BILA|nr:unnamed protein product [Didymodactylos carnosus]CAF4386755.1 unnamed protein product [Didymodactylos carnosus]
MSVNPYDILRPPDDFEMDEMDDITSSPTEARKARLPKRNSPPHPSLRPQINNDSHRRTQSTRNIEKQSNGNNTRQVQKINSKYKHVILSSSMAARVKASQLANPYFTVKIKSNSGFQTTDYIEQISSGHLDYILNDRTSLTFVLGTNDIAWTDADHVIKRIEKLIEVTKQS